jgi:hypothetical protein
MALAQTDLFNPETPAVPRESAWHRIRLERWSRMESPTRGLMYRLEGHLEEFGLPVYKPLTDSDAGIRWAESSLRALGVGAYRLVKIRGATGLGRYLEGLLAELVSAGQVQATVYFYPHAEGDSMLASQRGFWTLRTLRKAS